ncbi:MAG TPA: Hpt domain-containing protein, partial [Arenimonas sp.]|nr:Hpt domain-containing protein [Arenimonas sp.]
MKLLSPIDVTVLTWLKPELDSTLHQARNSLEQFVEDGQGVAALRECGQHLHQVAGILNMVELTGPAKLAEEMEQLAGRLAEDNAQASENAFSLLMQCIVQLPDYLERLQNGHRDVPGVLLPLINELRSIGNHPPLSEEAVYTASTQSAIPDGALSAMLGKDGGGPFGELALQFQAHLHSWLNSQDDRNAAGRLAEACEKIVAHCQDDSSKKLFWVASCLLHAVAEGKLEATKALRQSIVKIDQEVSYINNRNSGEARQSSPVRLTQELLYFVSQAPDASSGLRQVYDTFELAHNIPDEDEIKHAKSSLLGRNNALLQSVSAVIKEDILRVKDSLDMAIRQTDAAPADMSGLVDVLARIESTLGLIDADKAKELIRLNKELVSGFVSSGKSPSEAKLMEIAKSLLSVEMMLDHKVADIAGRKQAKMASDFLSSSQSHQLLDALIRESIVNFTLARQAYVAFVESYWDHEQLAAIPTLLKQVSGALAILEFTPVSSYIDAINAFTRVEFIEKSAVPSGEQMERLAEVLASLEYYLESVRDRRPNRERILEITEKSLEALHYWPIPDYALHAVTAPVPAPATVEAAKPLVEAVEKKSVPEPAVEAPAAPAPVRTADATDWTIGFDESGDSVQGFDLSAEGIDDEIREIFLEEFSEESGNLHSFFDKWQAEPENVDLIRPIRRVFHTLKGSGRLVGAMALSDFSWKIESLLNRVLDETRPASDSVVSMVGIAIDALPKFQQALLGGKAYLDVEGLSDVAERLAAGEELVYQPKQADAVKPPAAKEDAIPAKAAETSPIIDPVLLEILTPEVSGHLETVNRWLQQAASADTPAFEDDVFRAIHTMNGAFAMTEVSTLAGVLAPAESLVRRSIAHHIGAKAEVIACLAQVADAVQATLDDLNRNVQPTAYPDLESWVAAKRDELPELPTAAVAPMVLADMEAERVEAERLEAERLEAERVEAERVEAARVEAARLEAERLEAERVEAERVEAERVEAERVEAERLEAERLEAERLAAERTEAERAEAERLEAERLEAERLEAERLEAERLEAERLEAERIEAERVEAERVEAE